MRVLFTDETLPLWVIGGASIVTHILAVMSIVRGSWTSPAFIIGALAMTLALRVAISRTQERGI